MRVNRNEGKYFNIYYFNIKILQLLWEFYLILTIYYCVVFSYRRCVGIEEDPEPGTDWFCSSCLDRKGKDSKDKQKKKKKKKNKEKEK